MQFSSLLFSSHLISSHLISSSLGKEHNFIKPADTAIVFQDFLTDEDATTRLTYSGNLSVEFDPSSLRISPRTGRLYHSASETKSQGFGLVRSQLAVSLAETASPAK